MDLSSIIKKIFLNFTEPLVKKNTAIKNHFKNLQQQKAWKKYFSISNDIIYTLDDNLKINLNRNSRLTEYILFNDFEKEEIKFFYSYLKIGDTVLDVGANIGLHTLHAANAAGANGMVYAFEPVLDTYNLLLSNAALNDFKNIIPVNIGLSDAAEELCMNVSTGYDAWNTLSDKNKLNGNASIFDSTTVIHTQKLDEYLKSMHINQDKISLVKIDVEGWEKFVLLGGREFFMKANPVLMIEFDENNTWAAGYLCHELYDLLLSFGYRIYRLQNGKLYEEEKKLHYPSQNLFAVKANASIFRDRISFHDEQSSAWD